MKIVEISEDSTVRNKLVKFAKQCSWQSTGNYLSELVSDDCLEANEKVFAAVENGEIVGYVALLNECVAEVNESSINLGEINVWLDFLFVNDAYRGQGISIKLIDKIFEYCKNAGIDKVYLITDSHEKMYEKYGFKNIGNAVLGRDENAIIMSKKL